MRTSIKDDEQWLLTQAREESSGIEYRGCALKMLKRHATLSSKWPLRNNLHSSFFLFPLWTNKMALFLLTCLILSFKTLFLNDSLHKLDWSNLTSLFRSFSLLFDCCSSFCKSVMKRFHIHCVPISFPAFCVVYAMHRRLFRRVLFLSLSLKHRANFYLKGDYLALC